MTEILILTVLGGLVALDETSLGQFMVYRPIVAGTLTGWILGHPLQGFAIGTILELYLLVHFPVGGARFPEGGPASVVAVAAAAASPLPGAEALGVAMGLAWGQLGGVSITLMRRWNTRRAIHASALTIRRVTRTHLTAVLIDFTRGALITLGGVLGARLVVELLAHHWPLQSSGTRSILLLGGVVSMGILLGAYGGWARRARLFTTGAGAGLIIGYLL